jgi:hypothetical protein
MIYLASKKTVRPRVTSTGRVADQQEPLNTGVDQQMENTSTGFVYLVHAVNTHLFKIGFSLNPEKRLAELQTGNPHKLQIVKTWRGSVHSERAIHRQFQSTKRAGEWFLLEDMTPVVLALDTAEKSFAESPYQPIKPKRRQMKRRGNKTLRPSSIAPDLPPRGSALNIETALTYARKAHKLAGELQKVDPCNAFAEMVDFLNVVIEQLQEVNDKIKRQSKLNAP